MQDHRHEALGKPVFEDLEPGYFARVQSVIKSKSYLYRIWSQVVLHRYKAIVPKVSMLFKIWNLIVLHGYKAKRYKEQICSRFGTWLFIIRIDLEIITVFIGYLDIKADFAAFNLFTN